MGVLAPLVLDSNPAWYGDGLKGAGTAGATWRLKITFTINGTPVDFTGVTVTCHIVTSSTTTIAMTASGDSSGMLTFEVDESATAGLSSGSPNGSACPWWASANDGTDTWQIWSASNSRFVIYPEGA